MSNWKYVWRKDHGYFTFAEVVCGTRLESDPDPSSDEIAVDLMLLTVNDVCVSLFVGDCFPIAGISIKLAGLGHYLLLWIGISGTPTAKIANMYDFVLSYLYVGNYIILFFLSTNDICHNKKAPT
jgi:hypothetical protein